MRPSAASATPREKRSPGERPGRVIALAGNPNVGKSTVFNALTGLRQHTGNWPGKTVASAEGSFSWGGSLWKMVDLPGTYSLLAHSAEEEVARDYLCSGQADAAVVVCDATCLAHSLTLALQVGELFPRMVVCVNLMDEARKKGIRLDLAALEDFLGVPVVGTSARSGKGLHQLMEAVERVCRAEDPSPLVIPYSSQVEEGVTRLMIALEGYLPSHLPARWAALRLLEGDRELCRGISRAAGKDWALHPPIPAALSAIGEAMGDPPPHLLRDRLAASLLAFGEEACSRAVLSQGSARRDRMLDRIFISRAAGIPVMLLLLTLVLWLTITGANYPSQLLSRFLFGLGEQLSLLLHQLGAPAWLHDPLIQGVWRVLAWVVSVMLPPMAIFFPLFTLLEDFGYLPRAAFNLDHCFQKAKACGKQALTMAMGFGCNAAGVVGCRIIDSPRERLIAILTNNFVPCNGRFPTLIAVIAMFFSAGSGLWGSVGPVLLLTGVILLGVFLTFFFSRLLSATLLKGVPSSFTLELPPYRRPQVGKVLARSILDRTLFVLRRAVAAAAPAGLVIWLMANLAPGGVSLLDRCAGFLDPLGQLLGMDGIILLAFILGFPANEIVVPIMIMGYLSTGTIAQMDDLTQLRLLLVQNGWTWATASSVMLFSLAHWPCSTTCLTIAGETRSLRWTLLSIALPTAAGMALCFLFTSAVRLLGLA